MEFGNKILSKEIAQIIWDNHLTLGTAESCTGGRIAEAIIAIPGASAYFKGSVVSYTDEIKERLLNVSHALLEDKGAVSQEVATEMVRGAIAALNVDYAISVTGFAGPAGGTKEAPVGTIWIACGKEGDIVTRQLTEDQGRDINLSIATATALEMFLDYLKERFPFQEKEE